jgi:4-diphosphocytidyl-2-C-methyl-D-erythritol kinase
MILFPPAKINLGLKVLDKRTDGYHNIESVMFQIPFCDILEIVKSEEFSFKSTGLEISGNSNDNLCVKAYEILKNKFNVSPVSIHLHKIIPMGAGLGGGSSDGTYTLLILNQLFELNLSEQQLREFALELGSDCPLFVNDFPQIAKGRGELLEKIEVNLSGKYLYIINLGIHVSTKEAFQNLELNRFEKHQDFINLFKKDYSSWKNNLINDFEYSVFKLHPELANLKEKLYKSGAVFAAMTGSGSTLFALFENNPQLINIENEKKNIEKIIQLH